MHMFNAPIWHYTFAGMRRGPVSEDQMRRLIVDRKLNPNHCLVWKEGMEDWLPLHSLPEFAASIDLVERLDQQKSRVSHSNESSLRHMLELRSKNRPTSSFFLSRRPQLSLCIRLLIGLSLFAAGWAWMNRWLQLPYWLAAILCIFTTLVFTGPKLERHPPERFLIGACCALAFIVTWYLGYLTNHGAIVGESLLKAMLINHPISFLLHYLDTTAAVIWLTTFAFPFTFAGFLYHLPLRHPFTTGGVASSIFFND